MFVVLGMWVLGTDLSSQCTVSRSVCQTQRGLSGWFAEVCRVGLLAGGFTCGPLPGGPSALRENKGPVRPVTRRADDWAQMSSGLLSAQALFYSQVNLSPPPVFEVRLEVCVISPPSCSPLKWAGMILMRLRRI